MPPADKGVKGFIGTQNKRLRIEIPNGEAAVPEECGGYLYWNGEFYKCASDTALFLNTLFDAYVQIYFVPHNER